MNDLEICDKKILKRINELKFTISNYEKELNDYRGEQAEYVLSMLPSEIERYSDKATLEEMIHQLKRDYDTNQRIKYDILGMGNPYLINLLRKKEELPKLKEDLAKLKLILG